MSTIASPRPSTSAAAPSSSRSSLDTGSRSSSRTPGPNQRRHRAALRDYYGLQKTSPPLTASSSTPDNDDGVTESPDASELDRPGFSADEYVTTLLQREGLERVLRVEGGLVGDIRGLDGERKALVYDNYSKLIAATETIRKMKNNMDPLGPTSTTLGPTIAHIADTSAALLQRMTEKVPVHEKSEAQEQAELRAKQLQTVRWVIETPQRMLALIAQGKRNTAQKDFTEVLSLLEKWKGVGGADHVRTQCEAILNQKVDGAVP